MLTGNELRPDIEYSLRPASPLLSSVVQCFIHGYSHTPKPHRLTIPPSDGLLLSFVRGAPLHVTINGGCHRVRSRLFIGGQLKRQTPILESQGRFDLIGILFSPCGFHQLFHTDVDRFTDTFVELRDFLPDDEVRHIEAQWLACPDSESLFQRMEAYLLKRLPAALSTPDIDHAVAVIQQHQGQIRVEDLAKACQLSERHLHRRFLKVVGVGPKHFAKTIQLKSVLTELEQTNNSSLNRLAQDHGYFDQSHFVHDFQRFVGMNPQAFLQDESPFLSAYLLQQSNQNAD